jgi:hypothetical protein
LIKSARENNKQVLILFVSSGYSELRNRRLNNQEITEEVKSILGKLEKNISGKTE